MQPSYLGKKQSVAMLVLRVVVWELANYSYGNFLLQCDYSMAAVLKQAC